MTFHRNKSTSQDVDVRFQVYTECTWKLMSNVLRNLFFLWNVTYRKRSTFQRQFDVKVQVYTEYTKHRSSKLKYILTFYSIGKGVLLKTFDVEVGTFCIFCTWTLTSNVLKSTPFPPECYVSYWLPLRHQDIGLIHSKTSQQ